MKDTNLSNLSEKKNKSQSEDNFIIIMYMRSFWSIYIGLFIILFGVYKIFRYFF